MGTVLAARDVPAERHRSAALDGAHHLELAEADVTGVGGTPGGPVVAEDVRDLQCWAGQGRDALRRRLGLLASPGPPPWLGQQVERALDAGDHAGGARV